MVKHIREELLRLGCDVRFGHKLTGLDVRDGILSSIRAEGPQGPYDLPCDALVLAPGHSARDTFQMLLDAGGAHGLKPFAVGVRIEHSQSAVSQAQFGRPGAAARRRLQALLPSAQRPQRLYLLRLPRGGGWWPPPLSRGGW